MATIAGPVTPAVSPGSPVWLEEWKKRRTSLQREVAAQAQAYEIHPGRAEWEAYLRSESCRRLMATLNPMLFRGTSDRLAKHWDLFFTRTVPQKAMAAFTADLIVQVFIPAVPEPSSGQKLSGCVITYTNQIPGEVLSHTLNMFQGTDKRFPYAKPVLLYYWKNDLMGAISPSFGYHVVKTFHFTENGKRWETGDVLAESAMLNSKSYPLWELLEKAEAAAGRLYQRGRLYNHLNTLRARLAGIEQKIRAWGNICLPEGQMVTLLRQMEMFESGDRAAPRGILLSGAPGNGKTLVASALADSIPGCRFQRLTLADIKHEKLGASGQKVREIWNLARQNQPSVIFLDECEGMLGRRGAAETDVIATDIVQAFLAEWDRGGSVRERILVVGATNRKDMLDDAILSRFDTQMEVGLPAERERARILCQEIELVAPGTALPADMASLTQGMSGRDLGHLARKIRTLAYPGTPEPRHFHEAVQAGRKSQNTKVDSSASWNTLVLDAELLRKLKLTCTLLRDAERWKEQGVDVPRSLLLSGPAGTGKTQIARTLANEGGLSFLAATTADMKANFLGQSGNRVKQLFERARTKAPVILFLDELDIVAPDRSGSNDALTEEIVGQLLQEMDGIEAHDGQVFLLAATNHADEIDRAVLSRFRETIHVSLPGEEARAKLLTILLGKKRLGFHLEAGTATLAGMSEGRQMSGRDLQSWIGRAEQKALLRALDAGGPEQFQLLLEDFDKS